ncbi:MAG: SDR family NAD(P)-dependent oxidoreductase [Bacteroidales bacterium]|nr:SDR family NAD(P)-dependent oxidoreductase [Bacteroidales bacterium]
MLKLLNLYCDGYVATPIIEACQKYGLFKLLENNKFRKRKEIIAELKGNVGYFTIALQTLELLGWLEKNTNDAYRLTNHANNEIVNFNLTSLYAIDPQQLIREVSNARMFSEKIEKVLSHTLNNDIKAVKYLEGAVIVPLILALKDFDAENFCKEIKQLDAQLVHSIEKLFIRNQWLTVDKTQLMPAGKQLLQAYEFDLTVSYRHMLSAMEDLLFGDHSHVFSRNPETEENHVNRQFNIIAGDMKNEDYLKDLQQAIITIFNQLPLEQQPQAIVNIGCGDGSLLKEIYQTIQVHTVRGQHLGQLPIDLFGVDYYQQALEKTSTTLNLAGIKHKTILGDASRPDEIIQILERKNFTSQQVLYIRSFIDHNLFFNTEQPINDTVTILAADQPTYYLDQQGQLLDSLSVLSSWQQQLQAFAQSILKSRLIVLQSHALPSQLKYQYLDGFESIHYDIIHNLSHQYLINAEAFITLAASVGLFNQYQVKNYPGIDSYCRMSLHHFSKRDYIVRFANKKDLKTLYQLEELCWSEQLRTPQIKIRERLQKYPQGQFVLEKDGQVLGVIYSQRIIATEELEKCNMDNVHNLHNESGSIIQLIAVNIHPQAQSFNYGDQLLEFMLQRCSLIAGISKIAAVTLCKNYDAKGDLPFERYIRQLDSKQDPILAFHHSHGAKIVKPLANYRPRDIANQGFGVLVEYNDIHNRVRPLKQIKIEESKSIEVNPILTFDRQQITQFVLDAAAFLLNIDVNAIDHDQPLMEMGLNSVDLSAFQRLIEEKIHQELQAGFFFEHNSCKKVIDYLTKELVSNSETTSSNNTISPNTPRNLKRDIQRNTKERNRIIADSDIAIIGMSCKLPGGIDSPDKLWEILTSEKCVISSYPKERGTWPSGADRSGIDQGGFMDNVDAFDSSFFRVSPIEAQITDPQQRILLELAWACLEDANILPAALKGTNIGVFVGASNTDYSRLIQEAKLEIEAHNAIGSSLAVLANRISYYFDFTGPSLLIDTACSSSLVALHTAIQSLRAGECTAALVGGVNLICHPDLSIAYHKAGMLAPDGRCKVFDAKANGYVRSEGAAILLLKPLRKAIEDQNQIHAVIKGSSINHGGLAAGLTVPNPKKQSELLIAAWKNAGISVKDITYIEAHGTGTSLGDPIEMQGIQNAYSQLVPNQQDKTCGIGSIKSNLGHLESAAGITGLLKVILSMKHQELPATINFSELNPKIRLNDTPFYIQNKLQPWETKQSFLAGVSSFGSGGANAHVVVQEYIPNTKTCNIEEYYLFVLSAINKERLHDYAAKVIDWLNESITDADFSDAIFSWQIGRTAMKYRLAIKVKDRKDLQDKLKQWLAGNNTTNTWSGLVNSSNSNIDQLRDGKPVRDLIEFGLTNKDIEQLGILWTSGFDVDWHRLYTGKNYKENNPQYISLPTYPFAKERYWINNVETDLQISTVASEQKNNIETLFAAPAWQLSKSESLFKSEKNEFTQQYVFLCDMPQINIQQIETLAPHNQFLTFLSQQKTIADQYIEIALACFKEIQKLLTNKLHGKTLVQIVAGCTHEQTFFAGLSGLLKTANLENPSFIGQIILTDPKITEDKLVEQLKENQFQAQDLIIKYELADRYIIRWQTINTTIDKPEIAFKNNGVYLITGGLGGLAILFAKEILQQTSDAKIILTDLSKLTTEKQAILDQLSKQKGQVVFRQLDINQLDQVKEVIGSVKKEFKHLNGIIHCAGMIKDSFILKKTPEEFSSVLKPKVNGTFNLDLASQDIELDFFVLFSSIVGVVGNLGQADYASANGFMDQFSTFRNQLVTKKLRYGKTLAINWPLWQRGGMSVDQTSQDVMQQTTGMMPMKTSTGIQTFYRSLSLNYNQTLVMEGILSKIKDILIDVKSTLPLKTNKHEASNFYSQLLFETTLQKIKQLLGKVIKLSASKIDEYESLSSYGIDSIFINQLNLDLTQIFGAIPKTLFFEYQTLSDLTHYFIKEYTNECISWTGLDEEQVIIQKIDNMDLSSSSRVTSVEQRQTYKHGVDLGNSNKQQPIAIIGMSGIYPYAANLDEYWENLKSGKNCISEIPSNRWSLENFYEPNEQQAVENGKSYSKWGGFIEQFSQFDPLFFGISPREAMNIDPQERLFLQEAWRALENSGYTSKDLKDKYKQRVGVFAGVTKAGFELNGSLHSYKKQKFQPHTSFSSVANRLSFHLDLTGPSMPIDTMCSSSLTAIHEACEHINRGECSMAFAGGVNVYLHPSNYVYLCSLHMLSVDGLCKSYGVNGNGFVPGEGVGVVLLKPLADAIRDNDVIHGVILATDANHGGKTNGYTIPNPKGQAELIRRTIEKAGISARDISYVEGHGTGTELGDPIEITGLQQAFSKDTKEIGYCNIGSVKSNIGHLEAAAGISALTKVLLQLKHGQIVPSLHAQKLNPNIDFQKTPFVVNNTLKVWDKPIINNQQKPRIAGISSFGAGGSNAHIIVQEYISPTKEEKRSVVHPESNIIIPLSARKVAQLKQKASDLLTFIRTAQIEKLAIPSNNSIDLHSIAYTLQVGREGMEERVAFVVNSIDQLVDKLQAYVSGEQDIEDVYQGRIQHGEETLTLFNKESDLQQTIDKWIAEKRFSKLLKLWVKGLELDWSKFYSREDKTQRICLPTYPFAKDEFWVDTFDLEQQGTSFVRSEIIHPLLHVNTSNLSQQSYSSIFSGEEFFLKDNKVNEVVCLEMARAAVNQAISFSSDISHLELRNITWSDPFVLVNGKPITIALFANGLDSRSDEQIDYEIYSTGNEQDVVHCQGQAVISGKPSQVKLNISHIKEQVKLGNKERLVQLSLSDEVVNNQKQYLFHPSLMDGVMQVAEDLIADLNKHSGHLFFPIALESLKILSDITKDVIVWVRFSVDNKVDDHAIKLIIDIMDQEGNVCMQMQGLSFRISTIESGGVREQNHSEGTLFTVPVWQPISSSRSTLSDNVTYTQEYVVLCDMPQIKATQLETLLPKSQCITLLSSQKSISDAYSQFALSCFELIHKIVTSKPQGKVLIQIVAANAHEKTLYVGLSGLLKTAALENPKIFGQIILTSPQITAGELATQLQNDRIKQDVIIKYVQGVRNVLRWQEMPANQGKTRVAFKDQGVYLITGGLGGLGVLFCNEIIKQTSKAKIILVDRLELTASKKAILETLTVQRKSIEYRQLDISDLGQVKNLIATVISDYKQLNGIIHCAGMISDNFILKKSAEEFGKVLVSKVTGTYNLDQATKNVDLDFLVLFSSIASAMGSLGQSDYATANGFMDQFAHYRNQLVVEGERQGQTLAINWSLWQDGGMNIDNATKEMVRQTIGMHSLRTATGMQGFHRSLEFQCSQSLIIEGELQKIAANLDGGSLLNLSSNIEVKETHEHANIVEEFSQEQLQQQLKVILSEVLQVKTSDFGMDQTFADLGLNSILGVELVIAINKKYGTKISNVIVYDYPNVKELAILLDGEIKKLPTSSKKTTPSKTIPSPLVNAPFLSSGYSYPKLKRMERDGRAIKFGQSSLNSKHISDNEKIAIVGMSGKYPDADNLQQYWENLMQGKNSIVEFPSSRWDVNQYYDPDPNKEGKTYCKWVGMLNDVDHFDPLFFRISPQEAINMDPEQRLFLQESYKAFEDAGYSNNALNNIKCGVYLGMESSEYSWHFSQNNVASTNITGNHSAIAAARIAYFLNLKGPALSINTACSSSLVAIHLACKALVNNEVNMALAGGVRLWLSPETHIGMCQARMLSPKGQCKTFDDSADGIVMGEGVGAIILKRLSDAQADNDKIYGVILGSGINQDGKTNGITAPSVKSQIELEREIYSKYDIHPETISYIETHGTGTKLGDPIELEALTTVFTEKTDKKNYCAIASVKTNIGHTAAASGIASIQKVLLSIQHRTLVPTLNVTKENSNFDFKNSPFYINKEKKVWDASPNSLRRASVSSFGFSGTNAHMVIEEYLPTAETKKSTSIIEQNTNVIIPISARTPEQLKQRVRDLLDFIRKAKQNNQLIEQAQKTIDLVAMAYTLQTGRETMDERLGFIVSSIDQLAEKLQAFINGDSGIEDTYQGQAKIKNETLSLFSADADLQETIDKWMTGKKLSNLLSFWVKGLDLDWNKLYDGNRPQRISLPTYPFAKERYWIENSNTEYTISKELPFSGVTLAQLHPLVHSNTSDLSRQSYSSTFTGDEFFIKDHEVHGKKVFPGVAYLEMVRAAVEKASPPQFETKTLELHNVVWVRPIVVTESKQVTIALFANEIDQISFEIYTTEEGQEILHCQGNAIYKQKEAPVKHDLVRLKEKMQQGKVEASSLYSNFVKMGIYHGPAFQGFNRYHHGGDQLIAELTLPSFLKNSCKDYVLHPSMMDSVLQSCIGLIDNLRNISGQPPLPYGVDCLRIISGSTNEMISWVRYSPGSKSGDKIIKLDIDLCDKQGNVCVEIRGFSSRVLESEIGVLQRNTSMLTNLGEIKTGLQFLVPVWNPVPVETYNKIILSGSSKILLLGGNQTQLEWLQKSFPNTTLLQLPLGASIDIIIAKFKECSFEQLVWIAPDVAQADDYHKNSDDLIVERQEEGVLAVFRVIKTLLKLEYADKELLWTIITSKTQKVKKDELIHPAHAGIVGLIGSLAKEYSHWNLRLLDIDSFESVSAHECLSLAWNKEGNGFAYRQGEWFCQELACMTTLPETTPVYKQNGVYVVIGGAGGLGEVWSRFMVEHYRAKIVWIGRRESNAAIEDKIKTLGQLGDPPMYISADATKLDSLEQAFKKISKIYPSINGVVHSAIVLQDQSLMAMEESRFRASLSAKVDISANMNRVFGELGLDFMLFFSSLSSFHKGAGQSNYNAGCTFKDSFAHSLQKKHSYPVKIVNWGYWGSVGIVADDFYNKRMVQMGFGSIEPEEGMSALQSFIGSDINQMVILKTINNQALEDLNVTEAITYYPNARKASR